MHHAGCSARSSSESVAERRRWHSSSRSHIRFWLCSHRSTEWRPQSQRIGPSSHKSGSRSSRCLRRRQRSRGHEHEAPSRPFERARTELAYGEFLRRHRRRVDAREHLRPALETFLALGARQWAERARAELRASGENARSRRADPDARLTPQEFQIARFVAKGLSNREVGAQLFLSPRTVDFHLRNVFAKLEIASRNELATLQLDSHAPAR